MITGDFLTSKNMGPLSRGIIILNLFDNIIIIFVDNNLIILFKLQAIFYNFEEISFQHELFQ